MTVDEITKEIGDMPLPVIASGLLNYKLMTETLKKGTSEATEFDSLKLSDEELRSRFGARIKIMRQFFGLTQAELAARTGTTKATIASYETGRRAASYRNLIALSRTLGVSTDWLLGAEPPQEQ